MKRSKHSLSHYKLFSCDMGELIPCGLTEVLPGDTVQQATSALVRCAPLLAPPMHPTHCRIHHWFVPHRIIWEDWEDFITGGPSGADMSVFPTITFADGVQVGSLADYLGVPTGISGLEVSALPFRAYAMIYNEWYRDQDLQTELVVDFASGDDTTTSTTLQNVAWEKDYFTSSRPWEQKGPSVTVPLGTQAPVKWQQANGSGVTGEYSAFAQNSTGQAVAAYATQFATGSATNVSNNSPYMWQYADLSGASAISINLLREAAAIERFQEARARYGSRYVEYLRYLGVRSSDARLQRPEYLGGGRETLQFSEVLATAGTDDNPVGQLRGHGIAGMRSNRYRRFFEEHGYVLSLFSVRPVTMYPQGLFRTWNRRTREDFWQREYEHIGQQEVLNKEVYAAHSQPDGTFGYQDRYDEYRHTESSVAGQFRTSDLDYWHMARIFDSDPALNASFVKCVPTKRDFAVEDADALYVMTSHSIQARRLVAARGNSFLY